MDPTHRPQWISSRPPTKLVRELMNPVAFRSGLFVAGKFDPAQMDVPYSTLAQAFRELVRDLLAQGEDEVAAWRQRLRSALGVNAGLMVEVIPPLALVLGEQPPVPDLPFGEAKRRFHMVFRQLLGAMARAQSPVVLFVDDLQWADRASLELLVELLTHPDTRYVLAVGAYREREITPAHRLAVALAEMRRSGLAVRELTVPPLSPEHLSELVGAALRQPPAEARPLALLVHEKTAGNPFFAIQFLLSLKDEGIVRFDPDAPRWRWDLPAGRAHAYTENVLELMVAKLRRLPRSAQVAVGWAAAMGDVADAKTLACLRGQEEEEIHRELWDLVRDGLLIRSGDLYRFAHDRVQEAAYTFVPEDRRGEVHLRIGRHLLSHTPPERVGEAVFDIVGQLNRGAGLMGREEERLRLAELDLLAARRARAGTAYDSAARYAAAGTEVLPARSWERRQALAFALHLERAECEFLRRDPAEAERCLEVALSHAGSRIERAACHRLRIAAYTVLGDVSKAVDSLLACAALFGLALDRHPPARGDREQYESVQRCLGGRRVEDLVDLPPMADPEIRAFAEVLIEALPAAYFQDRHLVIAALCEVIRLSIRYGNAPCSATAYAALGALGPPVLGLPPRETYPFAELAHELVERGGLLAQKARISVISGFHATFWVRHLSAALPHLAEGLRAGAESGDLTYACSCACYTVAALLARGDPLDEVYRQSTRLLAFVRGARYGDMEDALLTQRRLMRALMTGDGQPSIASGEDASEDEGLERRIGDRIPMVQCWYHVRRLQERFLLGDHKGAAAAAAGVEALLGSAIAQWEACEHSFFRALALAALEGEGTARGEGPNLVAIRAELARNQAWAEGCAENFAHRQALIGAELARLGGEDAEAMRRYEQAIHSARGNGFVQDEALAYELASSFYRARGYGPFADLYLREARACYARWGAYGKVKQLDQLHPQLVERHTLSPTATFAMRSEQLDLLSVVKASQAISGEMVLEKLVGTLFQAVLEQGAARRGYLVLERESGPCIEAEGALAQEGVATRILQGVPVESSPLLPTSIIQYVRRTREPVILEDALGHREKWASDPYFTHGQPRSLVCLPILRQAQLVGILHLENDLVAGAFTPDRMTVLSMLASQVAISVENARLLSRERETRERAERATEELAVSEARLRLAQDAANAGTWEWDLRTNENFWSEGAWRLYGLEPRRVQPSYEAWRATIHPEDRARVERVLQDAVRSGRELSFEWRVLTRDGTMRWLMTRGQPVRDADGQVVRYLGISVDITERKRAEEALREEDRRKSQFIGVLSHELRNPLAAIRTSAYILDHAAPGGNDAVRAKNILTRQLQHLTRLVDDLLDVTRISRGKVELRRERVDLRSVVVRSGEDLRSSFAEKQVELRQEMGAAPVWIDADPTRIAQVLGNLLQNGVKFTPARGSVTVQVAARDGAAELRVRDTGVGIRSENLEVMFEPFAQSEQGLARTEGGLGLGLALSKGLVELHGGSLRARSDGPGRGAEFLVVLPLAPAPAAATQGPGTTTVVPGPATSTVRDPRRTA